MVSLLLDDDEINRKVQAKVSGSDSLIDGESNSSPKSNKKKNKAKRKLNDQNNENLKDGENPENINIHEENSLTKRLKLEQDESSNYSHTEGFVDIVGDEDDRGENSRTSTMSNGKMVENSRSTSPIFDFLGEKMGPKKPKRGMGGKRGRPPSSNKSSPLRGVTNSSGDEATLTPDLQQKIREKPSGFKQGNRPMNQGDMISKTAKRSLHDVSISKQIDHQLITGQMNSIKWKSAKSQSSSSQSSSQEQSPSLTPAYTNMSPQSAYNDERGNS